MVESKRRKRQRSPQKKWQRLETSMRALSYPSYESMWRTQEWFHYPNCIDSSPSLSHKRVRYAHPHTTWDELECRDMRRGGHLSIFKFKVACRPQRSRDTSVQKTLSGSKVFVAFHDQRRKLRCMQDYARHCRSGVITRETHDTLFAFLERQRRRAEKALPDIVVQCWNHNTDIPILHFKFRPA